MLQVTRDDSRRTEGQMKRLHDQAHYAAPKLQRGWDDLGGGSSVGPVGKSTGQDGMEERMV